MYSETEDLVRDLAGNAEGVCRAYLSKGRREGSYWIVGDLQNNPGRSLFVRLTGPASGPGAAGKFTEHVAYYVEFHIIRMGPQASMAISWTSSAPGRGSRASPTFSPRPERILAVRSRSSRIGKSRGRPRRPVALLRRRRACLLPRTRSQARLLRPTSVPEASPNSGRTAPYASTRSAGIGKRGRPGASPDRR